MRRLVITVTALCALAAATPARAFGDLQNCDAIKDAGERMTCLYAHIAHLEQTLLSFSTDITDLRRALKEKVDANGVYKLQYVGKGTCLGYADNDRPPVFQSCDRPDSWKLARGSQSPKGAVAKTPSPDTPDKDKSADKGKGKDKNKDKNKDRDKGKPKDKPEANAQPPAAPQPQAVPQTPAEPLAPAEPQAN
jgi:hypothetical protein